MNEDLEEIKTEAMENSPRIGGANNPRREEKELNRHPVYGSYARSARPEGRRKAAGSGSQQSVRYSGENRVRPKITLVTTTGPISPADSGTD